MAEGVVVLGGDYRGLGVVQSLGRRGIPAIVLHERRREIATFSRYVSRAVRWPEGDDDSRIEFLLDLALRLELHGSMLVPTRDDTAALCARNLLRLGSIFRVSVPGWDVMRWAYDKRLTNQLAADAGVPTPRTWDAGFEDIDSSDIDYPVIVKPAVKSSVNALTVAKAWRADEPESLARLLERASALMPASELLVQELIPSDGRNQFSFAALALEGRPITTLVARRTRQYPMDFGRASTFVETVEDATVADSASRILKAMKYTGLAELEFMRDPRTETLKLLDINARVWGWHSVGRRVGMDFSLLLWRLVRGDAPAPRTAPAGVRWMWPAADVPTAFGEICRGRLSFRDYARNFRRPMDYATLTVDDPIPGLIELPLQLLVTLQSRPGKRERTKTNAAGTETPEHPVRPRA
jgi:D-aspartate ligase